jgi:hypothetical protein
MEDRGLLNGRIPQKWLWMLLGKAMITNEWRDSFTELAHLGRSLGQVRPNKWRKMSAVRAESGRTIQVYPKTGYRHAVKILCFGNVDRCGRESYSSWFTAPISMA